jgi:hypothetical protein
MCLGIGASSGSKAINNETGAAYGDAINNTKAEFGDATNAFNDIMGAMAPILKAGPMAPGESAQEASTINAATINQTAAQYKNAATAVKSGLSAIGGGNIALPSGVNIATEAQLAEAGAQTESSLLNSNMQQDYALGNKDFFEAADTVSKAPQMFSTANQAVDAESNLGKTTLDSQKVIDSAPTWQNVAMGAIGAGANLLVPGSGSLITGAMGGGTSGADAATSFLKG